MALVIISKLRYNMKQGCITPRIGMWRGFLIGFVSVSVWGASPSLEEAAKSYRHTDYEASLKLLWELPEKDAAVFDLIGKNYFMLGNFKKSSEYCERAVAADPSSSEYQH